MRLIKRYSNRKLYEPDSRRYVTLEDIAEMIRQGDDVQVVDHQSGADLTTTTLLQVVFEEEKRIGGLLPQVMVSRVIQASGNTFSEMREAVRAFLDPDQNVKRGIQQRLDRLVSLEFISLEESIRLEKLLLDPRLDLKPDIPLEDLADPERVEELLREVQRLEEKLKDLEKGES